MNWWWRLFHRKRLESELQAELQYHLQRQIADNLQSGITEAEARRLAALQFGGTEQTKEDCRDARGVRWLETTLEDVRFAWRALRKTPGFALVTIATLALAIGANSAVFTMANALLFASLPVVHPDRLVEISTLNSKGEKGNLSIRKLEV